MTDLWPQLKELLLNTERPARYINHEWGCTYKPEADYRFCMVYPDTYELGQANQAMRILCNRVHAVSGMAAERAYLPAPDFCDTLRLSEIPLFSLESCAPLNEFDVVGITLSHELAATNILEVLDLAGIPLHADERSDEDPLVIAGGPCTFNPEPFWQFFDVISLGEGEESLPTLLTLHQSLKKEGLSREAILLEIASLPGQYVPSLYGWHDEKTAQEKGSWIYPQQEGIPTTFEKCLYQGFSESSAGGACIVPFVDVVHDRLNVEVLRGCARGCRFCQAGMIYRPVRERSLDAIIAAVDEGLTMTGYDEVSLTSLSTTDHSQIKDILTHLNQKYHDKGVRISIPSQRLDSFGVTMADLVAGRKKGGLTFAPEAGTQRLRDVINKNITEDDLFSAIEAAFKAGWWHCKLYFMIGLPTETDEDIRGIAYLAQQVYERACAMVLPNQRGKIRISISCALFVPKTQTPFQWDGQLAAEEAQRRIQLLRSLLNHRAISVSWHDTSVSRIEALLGRGGRECSLLIEEAWKRGARFDAWTEQFNENIWQEAAEALSLNVSELAEKEFSEEQVLPWSHIDAGLKSSFLLNERHKARKALTTPDCTFKSCSACGVCSHYEVGNELQEKRHG